MRPADAGTPVPLRIRRAAAEDAPLLAALAATTLRDAYSSSHTSEEVDTHIAANFTLPQVLAVIGDPAAATFLAFADAEPFGYATLRAGPVPACVFGPSPVELARIYLAKERLGKGAGSALLRACLDEARRRSHETLWLGVWEANARALAFYTKWGFRRVGTHAYVFGSTAYEDLVMARSVAGGSESPGGPSHSGGSSS